MTIVIPDVADYDEENGVAHAALAYGKAGLYLAPTVRRGESPGKNPGTALGARWQSATVTGSADVWAVFGEDHPDACGIALHCGRSGVLAIDIDTEDATLIPDVVLRAIKELEPPSWTTRRGAALRGHYLFAQPPGRMIGNSGGKLGSGWGDIRGKNGVVILPGSWHPNTEDGLYHMTRSGVVPTLPDYIADLLVDSTGQADAATPTEVKAFLEAHVSELKPSALAFGPLKRFADMMAVKQGRHTSMTDVACWAMREARAGLYPAKLAASELHKALKAAVNGERDTTGEFMGILSWAIGAAMVAPEARMESTRENILAPRAAEDGAGGIEKANVVTLPPPSAPARVARGLIARIERVVLL